MNELFLRNSLQVFAGGESELKRYALDNKYNFRVLNFEFLKNTFSIIVIFKKFSWSIFWGSWFWNSWISSSQQDFFVNSFSKLSFGSKLESILQSEGLYANEILAILSLQ